MRFYFTFLLVITLLPISIFGLNVWHRSAFGKSILSLEELPNFIAVMRSEKSRLEKLESRRDRLLYQIYSKERIVQELVAQKIQLLEALAQIRALNTQDEFLFFLNELAICLPGSSDKERFCRYVINMAREILDNRSDEERTILTRLENEMRIYLGENDPPLFPF